MPKLFVYGTLKNPKIREYILGRKTESERAILPNFTKRKASLYYYVREREGDEVDGLLVNVTDDDILSVDRYENVPLLYTRKEVDVYVNGKKEKAWVYL